MLRRSTRRWIQALAVACLGFSLWFGTASIARAQTSPGQATQSLGRGFYYPYYYFPHNYWPNASPAWPEPAGAPYQRPPAYMAYPAFKEPYWRYEFWEQQRFYRGFHFWLDQF